MENSEFGFIHKIEHFIDVLEENPTSENGTNYKEIIKKWYVLEE